MNTNPYEIEIFHPYPPDPRYTVGDQGTILGPDRAPLVPRITLGAGAVVTIGSLNVSVSECVLRTFAGPPPYRRSHAQHRNHDAGDNHAGNLRWSCAPTAGDEGTK